MTVHAYTNQQLKLPAQSIVVLGEVSIDALLTLSDHHDDSRQIRSYETIQDQLIWRDLSFVIDRDQEYGIIVDAIRKIDQIGDVSIFDLYAWDHLPHDKKSIWLRFKISGDGSMTTKQINQIMDDAIQQAKQLWAELRKEYAQQ